MIPEPYVWLVWSSAFLIPWIGLFWLFPAHRKAMIWASLFTTPFGLTEPLFVPGYWNPPSLFNLAQRTGFDIESLVFCFGIGGVGAVLVNVLTRRVTLPVAKPEMRHYRHGLHGWVLFAPIAIFVLLHPFGWNPIYPAIVAMLAGAGLSAWCRPDLGRNMLLGGIVFLGYYALFLAGLEITAPAGYIERVWNLETLSGISLGFMPLEELLFAAAFGGYWAGVYEHYTWRRAGIQNMTAGGVRS
jgi:hypothetical protein